MASSAYASLGMFQSPLVSALGARDYQANSLATATRWGLGRIVVGDFPADIPAFGYVPSGEQLSGAKAPDGTVFDAVNQMYTGLLVARTIVNKGTLHEYHVNLESATGRFLKESMDLPYQEHSRADPMKAAVDAERYSRTVKVSRKSIEEEFLAADFATVKVSQKRRAAEAVAEVVEEAGPYTHLEMFGLEVPIKGLAIGAGIGLAALGTVAWLKHQGQPNLQDPNWEKEKWRKEGHDEPTASKHKARRSTPSMKTEVHLSDADLDLRKVDSAFANYFKTGYAYSSETN
jgi:hypothetical protein